MFKKNMKKGLSVLLSLAMVVTSVTINGKKADAADSTKATVAFADGATFTKVEKTVSSGTLAGTLTLVDGEEYDENKLSVAVKEVDWSTGNAQPGEEVDTITAAVIAADENDAKGLTINVNATKNVVAGSYMVVVGYEDSEGNVATDTATIYYSEEFKITLTGASVKETATSVTVEGEIKTLDKDGGEAAYAPEDGDPEVKLSFDGGAAEAVTVDRGTFEKEYTLSDIQAGDVKSVTATITGKNDVEYSASTKVRVTPAEGYFFSFNSGSKDWNTSGKGYHELGGALDMSEAVAKYNVDATENQNFELTLKNTAGNFAFLAISFLDYTDGNGDECGKVSAFNDKCTIDLTKVKDVVLKVGDEVIAIPDGVESVVTDEDGFRIDIYNQYAQTSEGEHAFFTKEANPDGLTKAGNVNIKFTVEPGFLTVKNTGGSEGGNQGGTTTVDATSATVTAVTMTEPANKNVVVTASSAAVTAAAVLKLDGKELGQIATQGVVVVTTAAGVKVDISTKAAVATKGATTATFAALFTVPANAATGSYPVYVKVATKGAVATTVGGVVGTLTINAATATVVDIPVEPPVVGNGTKSIKLAVNKATIGVKEKINVKITTKKTAAAPAAKKVTISKNSKKAVATAKVSGKKLVITGKKAGKTVITVKSGKKTAKITVTVKKAPKKVSLKDGKKAAKKTVSLSAKTKKKAVSKTYTIVLPKNTASYDYTIKKSGKKAIIKKVALKRSKAGVTNKVVVTVKKGAKGSAKVVLVSKANKKAKATIKVKATK